MAHALNDKPERETKQNKTKEESATTSTTPLSSFSRSQGFACAMSSQRPLKRKLSNCYAGDGNGSSSNSDSGKIYKFQIQLPEGLTTHLTLHDPPEQMQVTEFIKNIQKELERDSNGSGSPSGSASKRRKVKWNPSHMYLQDVFGKKISSAVLFSKFAPNKCHLLTLHEDVGNSVERYKDMWVLTPYTDISELPPEYTFETALVDLIDNSLQAVWLNGRGERRYIGVTVSKEKIIIFDSGCGMDGTEDNSISKWGKLWSSNHRVDDEISRQPPYLQPFFGMFGYGAPISAMYLGRNATVSSKSKQCPKVYTLYISRDSLMDSSPSKSTWKIDGGIRNPAEDENELSPHRSFTWVEIYNLKIKCPDNYKLQCFLKDIYFPYIQCDEAGNSNKTVMPVEFEVNDVNLAEVSGGEMAIANLHSCNGPDFVVQLNFSLNKEKESETRVANARLKFVYFPIVEGEERINSMLKKLKKDGYYIKEQFENFSRVSIRRLGRLLPDARWKQLPLMDSKLRVGNEALSLRSCLRRVKCFVDTDAGFFPTPSKTDLAQDPFTFALKRFGSKPISNDKEKHEVSVVICRNGKRLSMSQLEKDYIEWVRQMHELYDQEVKCGEDEPTVILSPSCKRKLGITQDVIRVHEAIKRMGKSWKSGQKVKVVKGAISTLKESMYATLEYIIVEGLLGDAGGETRLICRPIEIPDDQGCKISDPSGVNPIIEIQKSVSFPVTLIDAGKIVAIDQDTFHSHFEKHLVEVPSIDILTNAQHKDLGIESVLSFGAPVQAGYSLPKELVAVIRCASNTTLPSAPLSGQKLIIKVDLVMNLEIVQACHEDKEFNHGKVIFTRKRKPISQGGIKGLYIFSLGNLKTLFKAGLYKLSFSATSEEFGCKQLEKILTVKPDKRSAKWKFCNSSPFSVRVGACLPSTSVKCYDSYDNRVPFGPMSQIKLSIYCEDHVLAEIKNLKIEVPDQGSSFTISDVAIESSKVDKIRQNSYMATIEITSLDGLYSATAPCKVLPGALDHVKLLRAQVKKYLTPGQVIKELILEMFDSSENHVEEGTEVTINVDNLSFQNNFGSIHKVNSDGCVDLSGLLKVDSSFGSEVCISVSTQGKEIFQKSFIVPRREIRVVAEVPFSCPSGSKLRNVMFEVVSDGTIDEEFHGAEHTMRIRSDQPGLIDEMVQYSFNHGRCTIPAIPVPRKAGQFFFVAYDTHYSELQTSVEVHVTRAPKIELESPHTPHRLSENFQLAFSPISCWSDESLQTYLGYTQELQEEVEAKGLVVVVKELQEEVEAIGQKVGTLERSMDLLLNRKTDLENEISILKAKLGESYDKHVNLLEGTKETMKQEIEQLCPDTMASVLVQVSKRAIPNFNLKNELQADCDSLVALLATVDDPRLSRVLAKYLGEDLMLSVISSTEGSRSFVQYDSDGKANKSYGIHKVASTLGINIEKPFNVIALDKISPFVGELMNGDAQKKLAIPLPCSPHSQTDPAGFVGYAVNLLNLSMKKLDLRATLFYHLFGQLQVYQTRNDMEQALDYIKEGAVSFDGAIMRRKGIVTHEDQEPKIVFPVVAPLLQKASAEDVYGIVMKITEKNNILEELLATYKEALEMHRATLKEFRSKYDHLQIVIETKSIPIQ
ncbi:gamma-irradiation and mitomycin c induced 1 [Rhynchospora pubera]|uniref:Gamma-irradiation and mitomycin c induced 1 n=1 Tax=Rhynchospora pubera TaxID=906938 RepID=A0AAV8ETB5_9POAL|nr:gamma-irradiation and mitomycin c induced 1 [Rhynchospora pubera]